MGSPDKHPARATTANGPSFGRICSLLGPSGVVAGWMAVAMNEIIIIIIVEWGR